MARAPTTRRGFLLGALATLGGVALAVAAGPGRTQAGFTRGAGVATGAPSNWLSLPADWDAGWRAARDAASSAPAWITILGDSIGEGLSSHDYMTLSWAQRLRAQLTAQLPWYGDFWPTFFSQSFHASRGEQFQGSPPFDIEGTAVAWALGGYGRLPLFAGPGNGSVTFTTPTPALALDVVYLDIAAGAWQLALDGVPLTTVQTSGSGAQRRVSLPAVTPGLHTLSCTGQSGDRVLAVQGVCSYANTSAGIGFANVSYNRNRAAYYISNTMVTPTMLDYWQGVTPEASSGFGFPTQPHLAIIALGINDSQHEAPLNHYRATLQGFVARFRAGRPDCSVLLLANCNPTQGMLKTFGHPEGYPEYLDVMRDVAQASGGAFVNLQAKWPDAVAAGIVSPRGPHPTDAGHARIAATLAPLILPPA